MRTALFAIFGGLVAASLTFTVLAADNAAPPEPKDMTPLFNGKDLTGWDGNPKFWSVKNGVIRGETTPRNPTKTNTFLILKEAPSADFELRFSYRLTDTDPKKPGDSGVQYRSKNIGDWAMTGYQYQIHNDSHRNGYFYHEKGGKRGRLALVNQKVEVGPDGKPKVLGPIADQAPIENAHKPGDWNEGIIIARGNHMQHYQNGVLICDLVDNDPNGHCPTGTIGLQIHTGMPMLTEFKDIRIKTLEPAAK